MKNARRITFYSLFLLLIFVCTSCDLTSFLSLDETTTEASTTTAETTTVSTTTLSPIIGDPDTFSLHMMDLKIKNAGDCIYIKSGENDILIDAGARRASALVIKEYVDQFCTDGKLEYVIATHADEDHIAAFSGNVSGESRTGILYQYQIGTIIDFAKSNKTTVVYQNYLSGVEYAVENGATHYTAAQCFNETDGASRQYNIGNGVTMNILYNYYYFNSSSNENNYSVCLLFTYNKGDGSSYNIMLTGDLEEEGEEKLAEYYTAEGNPTLPHCDLFKAGHHGSATSSNDSLLSLITPSNCIVDCTAGFNEYTANFTTIFPTQAFINRIAQYTDAVYVTQVYDELTETVSPLNGTIVATCSKTSAGSTFSINGSNNNTKLKDSTWFNGYYYVIDSKLSEDKGDDYFTAETVGAVQTVRRIWPAN